MDESFKKILTFAVAGTIVAGVPVSAAAAENTNDTVIEETNTEVVTYTVQGGDTLASISQKFYGSKAYYDQLAAYNHLEDANKLSIGQEIQVPVVLNSLLEIKQNEDKTYTVKCGDTMYCIVRSQYGLETQEAVDKLATYNGLKDPNRITLGQVLLIPELDKLMAVEANDYTDEYNRMNCILYHQAMAKDRKCYYNPGCNEYVIVPGYPTCFVPHDAVCVEPNYPEVVVVPQYPTCDKHMHPDYAKHPGCEFHPECGPRLSLKK